MIKNGDIVIISERNRNHLGSGITAYAGWRGRVVNLDKDGCFGLDCDSRYLAICTTTKLLVKDLGGNLRLIKHKIKK